MSRDSTIQQDLRDEARAYGRYLVGSELDEPLVARYVAAHKTLLGEPASLREQSVVEFTHRHPWSLSLVDAAAGLLRPGTLLRKKLLLLTAVLETTTRFAPAFLSRRTSKLAFVGSLAAIGFVAGARAVLGMPLLLFAERRGA